VEDLAMGSLAGRDVKQGHDLRSTIVLGLVLHFDADFLRAGLDLDRELDRSADERPLALAADEDLAR
jgi:hypothetical protein